MSNCGKCGAELPEGSYLCAKCGTWTDMQADGDTGGGGLILLVAAAAFIIVLVAAAAWLVSFVWMPGGDAISSSPGETTRTTAPPWTGNSDKTTQTTLKSPGGRAVGLDLYVMSQCPYGIQVLDALSPALKKVGDSVDFRLNYIANDNGGGSFTSLHGQGEVDEDMRQLCAMKYGKGYAYMDYITCRNQNIRSNAWESCATESGLEAAKIKACAQGQEGRQLLSASIQASDEANARGSPTIVINGRAYTGGRSETDLTRALCEAMEPKHRACSAVPKPAKIDVIVLNDARCKDCDTGAMESQLTKIFPGASMRRLEYGSDDGRKLYNSTGVRYLPAVLFDDGVKADTGYTSIQRYLTPAGGLMSLRIGATFDPTEEICDNHVDDTGDGKVDCADSDCKEKLVCREEKPKTLEVFIMSECPYCSAALTSMKDVLNASKDMRFSIHYIAAYSNETDTIISLHGQGEVDEDMRQLCAMKYYPEEYMGYIWCRLNDSKDADWKACAEKNGMNAAKMGTCAGGGEGRGLLIEDMKLAGALGINASPTWLVNNRDQFNGIDAQTILSNYCLRNQDDTGCNNRTTAGSPI
jgi:predicted DsbA family dithiol-disulfide isomerase